MTAPLTPREKPQAVFPSNEDGSMHPCDWELGYVSTEDYDKLAAELEEANKRADSTEQSFVEEIDEANKRAEAAERQIARYREKYGELE